MSGVSAVIPLYNKRKTIRRAISSILGQSAPVREIVIIDDGSTDDSAAIVQAIGEPLVRLIRQPNAGPGRARNRGVEESAATHIAFLDADDEWLPDHVATGMERLMAEGATAYVCGYRAPGHEAQRPNIIAAEGLEGVRALADRDAPAPLKPMIDALHSSCFIVERRRFLDTGGFFDRYKCLYGEDSWFYARLLADGHVYFDSRANVLFHVEDSALGFAVRKRGSARPLSLFGQELSGHYHGPARAAFDRLIGEYRRIDIDELIYSGAFAEAWRLRRLQGNAGPMEYGRDLARHLKWNRRTRARRPSVEGSA